MIAWGIGPVIPVIAGGLADYVTEPAMTSATWLSKAFGWMVGTSPGSGMALQFVIAGVLYVAIVLTAVFFFPSIRNLEDRLPDHDAMARVEESEAAETAS